MVEQATAHAAVSATFENCSQSWRWGLWSPNDRPWYEEVCKLWQSAVVVKDSGAELIPRKIHQVWLGDRTIPEDCQRMMATWSDKHPSWEYKLWRDSDVDSVLTSPHLVEAFAKAENPAEKSDIVRLGLILNHGGLYVDVDFECFQPVDHLHNCFSFYTGVSNVGAFELNNGIFAACPEHPLIGFLCDHVARPWPEWGQQDVDPREAVAHQLEKSGMLGAAGLATPSGHAPFLATTGPGFFTRGVMRALGAALLSPDLAPVVIFPPDTFYPLPNTLRDLEWSERVAKAQPSSLAMHHWCKTWA